MVFFSPSTKEITAKIIYYGPGMCGKTTNLQQVHRLMQKQMQSELVSVATETDRTIYFDFLPLQLGKIAGFDFMVRTFTVPGQPYYGETRKMVLQGADGIVFVADSQRYMLDQNKDSLSDLKRNLKANGLDYHTIPMILQYNKRDLPDVLSLNDLDAALNDRDLKAFSASAVSGAGVVETLRAITKEVFLDVRNNSMGGSRKRKQAHAQSGPRKSAAKHAVTVVPPAMKRSQSQNDIHSIIMNAEEGSAPIPNKEDIGHQEFQNLAVLHHKLQERVAQQEKEIKRISTEFGDLKRFVAKKLL